jgi:hypothetical protein
MWVDVFRLIYINILIAIGEALIISFVFKAYYPTLSKGTFKIIGIMILANYISWFAGDICILPYLAKIKDYILADNPLKNAPKFVLTIVIMAFCLTLILEWPFCLWAVRRKGKRIFKSIIACLLVNICSYVCLAFIYFNASVYSMYKEFTVQPVASFSKNNDVWIYFVSAKDGDVYRIHPNSSSREKICSLNLNWNPANPSSFPSLFTLPSDKENSRDLWLSISDEKKFVFKNVAFPDFNDSIERNWFQPENNKWLDPEISFKNKKTGGILHVGLEVRFLYWMASNVTYLQNDQIVCKLGNQVILIDLNKRLMGLITLGHSPFVDLRNNQDKEVSP